MNNPNTPKNLFLLFAFVIFFQGIHAQQQTTLTLTLSEYKTHTVFLQEYQPKQYLFVTIDSAVADTVGKAIFKGSYSKGFYKIYAKEVSTNPSTTFDLWIGEDKEIIAKAECANLNNCVQIEGSETNAIWYNMVRETSKYEQKLQALQWFKESYPDSTSPTLQSAKQEFGTVEASYLLFLAEQKQTNKDKMGWRLFNSIAKYNADNEMRSDERVNKLLATFFEKLDFSNIYLQRSPFIIDKIQRYVKFRYDLKQPNSQEEADDMALDIVKTIMSAVSSYAYANETQKASAEKYVNDYILYEFDKNQGLTKTYNYVLENLPASSEQLNKEWCLPEYKNLKQQREMESTRKRISTNVPMPNINYIGTDKKPYRLKDITHQYILVVFWSTKCKQSTALLDELYTYYTKAPKAFLEIVAVNVDTDKQVYEKYIAGKKYPWQTYADFKGTSTDAFKDFGVTALPMMYLIRGGSLELETIVDKGSYIETFIKNRTKK